MLAARAAIGMRAAIVCMFVSPVWKIRLALGLTWAWGEFVAVLTWRGQEKTGDLARNDKENKENMIAIEEECELQTRFKLLKVVRSFGYEMRVLRRGACACTRISKRTQAFPFSRTPLCYYHSEYEDFTLP